MYASWSHLQRPYQCQSQGGGRRVAVAAAPRNFPRSNRDTYVQHCTSRVAVLSIVSVTCCGNSHSWHQATRAAQRPRTRHSCASGPSASEEHICMQDAARVDPQKISPASLEWLLDTVTNSGTDADSRAVLQKLLLSHWHLRCFTPGTLAVAPVLGRRILFEVRFRHGHLLHVLAAQRPSMVRKQCHVLQSAVAASTSMSEARQAWCSRNSVGCVRTRHQ